MKKLAIVLVLIMFVFVIGYAETLEEILQKNYQVSGGIEKLKSIKNMVAKGKIVNQMNMEMPFKMIYKKPDKMRMEALFQQNKIVMAYDGEKAWWIMPFMGTDEPQEMPENQARDIKEQTDFINPFLDYKEKGHKLEYLGKEDMEGTEVYKLKFTKKKGKIYYYYLDIDTGIELKMETYTKVGENEVKSETFFSNYKQVDGMALPFSIQTKVNENIANQMNIEEYSFNEDINDSIFKMPAKKEETKNEENK